MSANQKSCCVKPYVPREPRRNPSKRRLNEHGILYIRHCQESNSQPVLSQAGADTTRPCDGLFWNTVEGLQNFNNFFLPETFPETSRKLSGNNGNIGSIDNFAYYTHP